MIQYKRIDVSEGTDVNKTSLSKECMPCHHLLFKDVGIKFEPHVCNKCHDLLTMASGLENMVILSAKGATFRCLRRLNNSVLEIRVSYKLKQRPSK